MARFDDPVLCNNTVTIVGGLTLYGDVNLPANIINNDSIIASANISASKLEHRYSKTVQQADGADVISKTEYIFIARAAAVLSSFVVRPRTAPTGGDKQFTVDISRAPNGSNVFTSLLSAVVTVDSSSVNNANQTGTLIGSPAIGAGDLVKVVTTISGTTGSQGQGVVIEAQIDEPGL